MLLRTSSGSLTSSLNLILSISFLRSFSALSISVPFSYSTVTIEALAVDCALTLDTFDIDLTCSSILSLISVLIVSGVAPGSVV